jgi:hypothetical protein
MIRGNSHIKIKLVREAATETDVQFDSPPKALEGEGSTLRKQFSLVERILGSLTNCWSGEAVVFD